ncbi:MAG: hypothetical protein ACJ0BT_02230 [Pseudohongiellaceae bacterium]
MFPLLRRLGRLPVVETVVNLRPESATETPIIKAFRACSLSIIDSSYLVFIVLGHYELVILVVQANVRFG